MLRRTAGRAHHRVFASAIIAVVAAVTLPAQAGVGKPAPNAIANSVEHGWTNSPNIVSVFYDREIDLSDSDVSVTDRNGDAVDGSIRVTGRYLFFDAAPYAYFSEDLAPYEATFSAVSRGQDPDFPATVTVHGFNVDLITPFPPNVLLNEPSSLPLTVSPTTEPLLVKGVAADDLLGSGVRAVTVHFYNPLANPMQATPGGIPEISSMARVVAMDCSVRCPTEVALSIDISDLGLGYWTIKVSTLDAAGNRSAQSSPRSVLRIAAP